MRFIKNLIKIYHFFYKKINYSVRLIKIIRLPVFIAILIFAILTTSIIVFFENKESKDIVNNKLINDVTGLNPIYVEEVIQPTSIKEIVDAISSTAGPISIGGGRYSQGGQIAYEKSLHLDMRKFNKIISLSNNEITVQSGVTWADIQEYIDPLNLSVQIMQTYANFTVGGSLSVNAHGRYIGNGPLVSSVKSIKVILADSSIIDATPTKNSQIFYGVIGGYGGLGVIIEATLKLDENCKIERKTRKMKISEYKDYFFKNIRGKKDIIFHNADIYPPKFKDILDISWYITDRPLTKEQRLIPKDRSYFWGQKTIDFVSKSNFGKWVRQYIIDPLYYSKDRIVWRNWEANYNVKELGIKTGGSYIYALREYFVPVERFDEFYPKMINIFQKYDVNIINISIRHANQDPGTLLAWAKKEVFAFVVYYRQSTDEKAEMAVKKWDKEMIDLAINFDGSYYLPYQIYASNDQFLKAYPNAKKYFELKDRLDPNNRFINKLWEVYYLKNHIKTNKLMTP